MQVIQDDRIIDPIPKDLTEIERVGRLGRTVMRWASGWGGVAYWPVTLDDSYTRAHSEGRQDKWQEDLLHHAAIGRRLLAQLYSMGGRLPRERYKTRELWRCQVELVEMLVMGITIINTRCSVLPHYWHVKLMPPVPYSDESASDGDRTSACGDGDDEDSGSEW